MWKNFQSDYFSIFICLSFSSFWFLSIWPFSTISTTNLCSEKYMSVLTLWFFKILCYSSFFSAENNFNRGITTDCSFFSIKLIWLNPKSALNLIIFRFDNLLYIIIPISISLWMYIECLLPINNLALYILYLLICSFLSSFMFLTSYFPFISLSIRS